MAAEEWTNLKHVDVCISGRNFLPSPSVEWSDKKMDAGQIFPPNKPFALNGPAVNPPQLDWSS
jgi:hypothetical protein